ncbi:tRNA methyltransferase non-catalytic subunit TRM6 [Parastagonospora nodorum]|uniref:tRNA (adenine(58)-N(1))-methyltransferase non-catalytic subunit TRM6 n=2 Tax=Phaeosphaeria nodorum (strain SN15 / ATCC MYA-4574 / FGSC 10173) TaxID=321614 RepID=A0A7U2I420_PHANO|nr:tRNA methyltransferase non-catalytic subunit TRM6 [Parastagonospora nodorum]QRD00964.1 tRNA methyltransferase non-catalytic subunit TRM6 [Parastagonospora nodorum SN15]KAH3925272.1 tRNA methyltransferase non-catalytic subunit TRM6 [Parastagonospora nodorum]KAH3952903.1 tRNA methyltransferase non-catalytic subunit TRM6 [Parastagonospora nodorum]KAH3959144.1 tRNA methyltransferase non-catalytic subunit TRM6 [Parastagonospora nodorum]
MHSTIRPNTHVALRLPSGLFKILETTPNTSINLGKFGTFNSNLIIGRPYYLTYELLDRDDGRSKTELRVVPAAELHAEALGDEYAPPAEATEETVESGAGYDIVGEDGEVIMRNNRLTIDDASRQKLSMEEIEELKKAGTGSGKDIIAKIMASHNAIGEKTTFSLAKYTLRKSRKYLKRFTALPMDVGVLTEYVLEKEAYKIMELREDLLGLICSWANIHCGATSRVQTAEDSVSQIGGGRWLVVDDTGGLVTAALAERMGVLYPDDDEEEVSEEEEVKVQHENGATETTQNVEEIDADTAMPDADGDADATTVATSDPLKPSDTSAATSLPRKPVRPHIPQMSARANTLTVLHANNQPNLSYLKYFGYDYGAPAPSHPLYKHLKSVSWLSLLHPEDDPQYDEPEIISDEVLATMKSSKRGTYYRKRRRWERVKNVVDEARAGGYDGLVVATAMDAKTVLKELVPLVRGGGKIVVYNQNVEPLVELCDYYSKERRAAFIAREFGPPPNSKQTNGKKHRIEDDVESTTDGGNEEDDFPLNPTLLLAPSLQTARARQWQVLPQRTHPMMTSRGGAEGYIFTATRVLPIEGRVEARGHHGKKKRKVEAEPIVQS